jgi:hypothetical protein
MRNNKLHPKTVNHQTRFASHARSPGARSPRAFSQLNFDAFLSFLFALIIGLPAVGSQGAVPDRCLARVHTKSIIDVYERKLFVTPDEVARYVFLTNRRDDGDRSAAVYRAPGKKESLPDAYWVTVTEAPDRLTAATRNMRVERHDAPLPASAAHALHALWEGVLKQSPLDKHAIPCAPTAVFSVRTSGRAGLSAVTVDLEPDSLCVALINLGQSLVDYAKLPESQRVEGARKIEKESQRLLGRLAKKR